MASKEARKREFTAKAREEIMERDCGCVFCQMGYHMEDATWYETHNYQIMHYIPRSQNGLGIAQNGAIGCLYHHMMLDNGNKGRREEMMDRLAEYFKGFYPDWDPKQLVYSKWNF